MVLSEGFCERRYLPYLIQPLTPRRSTISSRAVVPSRAQMEHQSDSQGKWIFSWKGIAVGDGGIFKNLRVASGRGSLSASDLRPTVRIWSGQTQLPFGVFFTALLWPPQCESCWLTSQSAQGWPWFVPSQPCSHFSPPHSRYLTLLGGTLKGVLVAGATLEKAKGSLWNILFITHPF